MLWSVVGLWRRTLPVAVLGCVMDQIMAVLVMTPDSALVQHRQHPTIRERCLPDNLGQ